ncbi:glycosyl hydrolase family 35, partial [Nonomuraea sp. NPDC049421]
PPAADRRFNPTPAGIPVELVFDAATVTEVEGPATVSRDGDRLVVTDLTPGTGCLLRIRDASGGRAAVLVLDAASALSAAAGRLWGARRLVLSERPVVIEDDRLVVYGEGSSDVRVFPAPAGAPRTDGVFGLLPAAAAVEVPEVKVEEVRQAGPAREPVIDPASGRASAPADADFEQAAVYRVTVPAEAFAGGDEVLLRLDWTGDVGRAYVGGRLVADQFWYGPAWEIGLRRFRDEVLEHGLEVRLLPLRADAPVFVSPQVRPAAYPGGSVLELRSVTLVPVPRTVLCQEES